MMIINFNLKNLMWWIFAIGGLIILSKLYEMIPHNIELIWFKIMEIFILILLIYSFIKTVFLEKKLKEDG